jgi:hypothetical protein
LVWAYAGDETKWDASMREREEIKRKIDAEYEAKEKLAEDEPYRLPWFLDPDRDSDDDDGYEY